jgi:tetratricopeptide (TPR) repeat protein
VDVIQAYQIRNRFTHLVVVAATTLAATNPPAIAEGQRPESDSAEAYTRAERLFWRADTLAESIGKKEQIEAARAWQQAVALYNGLGRKADAAATYSRIADTHLSIGQPDSGLFYRRLSLSIERDIGNRKAQAIELNKIGLLYADTDRPDSAIKYYHSSLVLRREIGDREGESLVLENIGRTYVDIKRTDSAVKYLHAALRTSRVLGDRRSEGIALGDLGGAYQDAGRPDSAFAYYRQALTVTKEVGDRADEATLLRNIGSLFRGLLGRDSALAYYRAAQAIIVSLGDRENEAIVLQKIGKVEADFGRPDSAISAYLASQRVSRELRDQRGEARIFNFMGLLYDAIGRPDSALRHYRESLGIARRIADRDTEALTLDNIGKVYIGLGRPDSALANFRGSLKLKIEIRDRRGEGWTINNIALVYSDLHMVDSALAYLRNSLAIAQAIGDRSDEGTILNNIAHQLDELGHPDSALKYYRASLAIRREVADRTGEGGTLSNLGYMHRELGQLDSALVYLRMAAPIREEVADRKGLGTTFKLLASVYYRMHEPDSALKYYGLSADLFAAVRRSAGIDENRVSYAETAASTYDAWISLWIDLAERATLERRRAYQFAALAAADRWMAQALLDLMRGTRVVDRRADLASEGDALAREVTTTGSSALVYHVSKDTIVVWLARDTSFTTARIRVPHDSLATWAGRFRSGLRVGARAARSLPPLETRPSAVKVARGVEEELSDSAGASTALIRLSDAVLPDTIRKMLPQSGEIVIIPHGVLALVPFAALPIGGSRDLLGSRLAIRYAPSLAALSEAEKTRASSIDPRESASLKSALVVGNPEMPSVYTAEGSIRLPPLAGAAKEGSWVASRLGSPLITGGAATEGSVRLGLPKATFVHLATHGVAYSSEAKARDSFVALAPDPTHDGLLTVGELLDDPALSLRSELIVLSACQTGLGDLKQAEGTVGLQRALLARGARSVLVSLWSVDDESTDALMRAFYEHWLEADRPSKAEALRRAQNDIRNNPSHPAWQSPRYWAAFQLVGAR